jgi:hypothetical protein
MDFISWPELGMSFVAVVAVFIAVTGLMMIVATELTEEGRWFSMGPVLPGFLLLVALFLTRPWSWAVMGIGLAIALFVPWVLVRQRKEECLRPIVTGQLMLLLGGGVVAVLIRIHYLHFVE